MRIYNGKDATINVPLPNGERMSIEGKGISKDFMPSAEFLNMIKISYDYSEIALIVAGIIEMNLCSSISSIAGFVVNSVSEAVERFLPKDKKSSSSEPLKKNPEIINEETEKKKAEEIKAQEKAQEKRKKSKPENLTNESE